MTVQHLIVSTEVTQLCKRQDNSPRLYQASRELLRVALFYQFHMFLNAAV